MNSSLYLKEKISDYLLLFFIIFPLVTPEGVAVLSPLVFKLIYTGWRYVSYLLVLISFVYTLKNNKITLKHYFLVFAFFSFPVLSCFYNNTGYIIWFKNYFIFIIVTMLVESFKSKLSNVIQVFLFILEVWVYVNFFSMIIFPGGMYYAEANHSYYCWVLGYKSSLQYYIIPVLCFSWINMLYRGKKLRFYLLLIISTYEAFYSMNKMLLMGMIIFCIAYFFNSVFKFEEKIKNYMILALIMNIVVVFFTTSFSNSQFGRSLLGLLGKDESLALRSSVIWHSTLQYIYQDPILGHGVLSSVRRSEIYNFDAAIHAHNQLLEYLYIGGIIMFGMYIVLNIMICRNINQNKKIICSVPVSVCIFIIHIMMIVEIYTRSVGGPIWMIVILSFYLLSVDNSYKKTNTNDYINIRR